MDKRGPNEQTNRPPSHENRGAVSPNGHRVAGREGHRGLGRVCAEKKRYPKERDDFGSRIA